MIAPKRGFRSHYVNLHPSEVRKWVQHHEQKVPGHFDNHYNDVIMSTMASQITSLTIVYSSVYSGTNQRKHQSSGLCGWVGGGWVGGGVCGCGVGGGGMGMGPVAFTRVGLGLGVGWGVCSWGVGMGVGMGVGFAVGVWVCGGGGGGDIHIHR